MVENWALEVMACIVFRALLTKYLMKKCLPVSLACSNGNFLSARKTDTANLTLMNIFKHNLDPYQVKMVLPDNS